MPAAAPVPSLSQIRGWDTEHLSAAATHWNNTAQRWDDAFDSVARRMSYPGGTQWEGDGAEAAQLRANSDLVKVLGGADDLRGASVIARYGAEELHAVKQAALSAVADAESAGFSVGEDLSVTSRETNGSPALQLARQAQAQALAANIRIRAAQLVALDEEVAARITTAAAGISDITFHESPPSPVSEPSSGNGQRTGTAQAVDYHTWKRSPPIPVPGTPDDPGPSGRDPNPSFPGRDVQGRFLPGNTGSADGAAAAEKRLQDYEDETGKQLIRQQIRVAIIDPKTGQPIEDPANPRRILTRYYDALEPTGVPQQYIGIEVKSGDADLTRTQKIFDGLVRPGLPATGNLNGQPVEIIGADKIEAPLYIPEPRGVGESVPAPGVGAEAGGGIAVPLPPPPVPVPPVGAPLEGGGGGMGSLTPGASAGIGVGGGMGAGGPMEEFPGIEPEP